MNKDQKFRRYMEHEITRFISNVLKTVYEIKSDVYESFLHFGNFTLKTTITQIEPPTIHFEYIGNVKETPIPMILSIYEKTMQVFVSDEYQKLNRLAKGE